MPASFLKKKKKSEGQSLSEVILRTGRVLHENQSVNRGQCGAGWRPAAQAHTATRTRTHPHPSRTSRLPPPGPGGALRSNRRGWRGRLPPPSALSCTTRAGGEDRRRGAPGRGRPEAAPFVARPPQPARGARAASAGACRTLCAPAAVGRLSIHWVVCRESSPTLRSHREARRGCRAGLCVGRGQVGPHA